MKSINNTTDSHLVNCCVIPGSDTMQEWEKEVFWKICALGNLQCNKNKNLKFRSPWKKYLKSNCIKSELVQKIFSSILLKLQVTSLYSPEKKQLFWKTHPNGYFCFYILQRFSNTNANNTLIYLIRFESQCSPKFSCLLYSYRPSRNQLAELQE